jgi:tellurite resistance protein TehA-like permease
VQSFASRAIVGCVTQPADLIPPTAWTIVMAAGVISIDLTDDQQSMLSAILLWFAATAWVFLVVTLAAPLVYQRGRFALEARSPAILTSAAATAVLGIRLAMQDYRAIGDTLLAVAVIGWAVFLVPVLGHWKTPTTGISFVVGVATTGVASLGAGLAVDYRATWLVSGAVVFLLLALACYVFTVVRFDPRQLISGGGDHWIAGGALAIAALAACVITEAAAVLGQFSGEHPVLTDGSLALWCLATAWLPVLIVCEVAKPRLTYDVRRWATVFPLGMYAACSYAAGQVTGITGITSFGQVWTWVALAAFLVALAGMVRRAYRVKELPIVHLRPQARALR